MLALAAALGGCATLRSQADEQLSGGDFSGAAASYDRILDRDPGNAEILALRDRARRATLAALLDRFEAAEASSLGRSLLDEFLGRQRSRGAHR